jgi:very-short-patch-repair endonuclease
MRRAPTQAEQLLWQELRGGKLNGLKFRRQHALNRFIVDFYCVQAGLVIEVDGPVHHYQLDADKERQEYLESLGLRVLRFTNDEVTRDIGKVVSRISSAIVS